MLIALTVSLLKEKRAIIPPTWVRNELHVVRFKQRQRSSQFLIAVPLSRVLNEISVVGGRSAKVIVRRGKEFIGRFYVHLPRRKGDSQRREFFDREKEREGERERVCGIFYTRDRMKSEKEGCGWQKPRWLRLSPEKLWLLSRLFICRWSFCSLRRLPQSRAAEIAPLPPPLPALPSLTASPSHPPAKPGELPLPFALSFFHLPASKPTRPPLPFTLRLTLPLPLPVSSTPYVPDTAGALPLTPPRTRLRMIYRKLET